MKLIIGLGNPGIIYRSSRHNIGLSAVAALAKKYKCSFKREKNIAALSAKIRFSQECLLALPMAYMNLSGQPIKELLRKYKLGLEDLLVVCDCLDLEFGRLRIRASGSSAGHRGLGSIINSLSQDGFSRLRIGLGRPPAGVRPEKFVLSSFRKDERRELKNIIAKAGECCQSWAEIGVTETMNIFNQKG